MRIFSVVYSMSKCWSNINILSAALAAVQEVCTAGLKKEILWLLELPWNHPTISCWINTTAHAGAEERSVLRASEPEKSCPLVCHVAQYPSAPSVQVFSKAQPRRTYQRHKTALPETARSFGEVVFLAVCNK